MNIEGKAIKCIRASRNNINQYGNDAAGGTSNTLCKKNPKHKIIRDSILLSYDKQIIVIYEGLGSWTLVIDEITASINADSEANVEYNKLLFTQKKANGSIKFEDGTKVEFENLESIDWV